MNRRPTQFGVRENTASPRQHAWRLTLELPLSGGTNIAGVSAPNKESGNSKTYEEEPSPHTIEPFVSADQAAQFLSVKRRYLLELARRGIAGAYPLGTGSARKIWVFRLSELAASLAAAKSELHKSSKPCTIQSGSPR
jgi:hypothetical protein